MSGRFAAARVACAALAVLLLAGCATPRPAAPPSGHFAVSPPPTFQLSGRLSVRQGETRHHVGIDWSHAADRDAIFVTGPLGQGLAELKRDASGARLTTADKQDLVAADWESLAQQAFGARLPLSGLPRWVTGAAPASTTEADGWRIDYLDFDDARGLPTLIELRRDDIEVRLKIDSWVLPQ